MVTKKSTSIEAAPRPQLTKTDALRLVQLGKKAWGVLLRARTDAEADRLLTTLAKKQVPPLDLPVLRKLAWAHHRHGDGLSGQLQGKKSVAAAVAPIRPGSMTMDEAIRLAQVGDDAATKKASKRAERGTTGETGRVHELTLIASENGLDLRTVYKLARGAEVFDAKLAARLYELGTTRLFVLLALNDPVAAYRDGVRVSNSTHRIQDTTAERFRGLIRKLKRAEGTVGRSQKKRKIRLRGLDIHVRLDSIRKSLKADWTRVKTALRRLSGGKEDDLKHRKRLDVSLRALQRFKDALQKIVCSIIKQQEALEKDQAA